MDIKPANLLVSNSHYKSYKHKELEMAFGKKPISCKLGDLGKVRSVYTQTNALAGKNCTTAAHTGSLAFMAPELIIEELSIASAGIGKLKTVDVWVVSMTFLAFCTRFPFTNVYKRVVGTYFVLFRSWIICKNKKRPGFYTFTKTIFF